MWSTSCSVGLVMKPVKCNHHGCKNKHKSTTGYCSEHAEDSVKHVVRIRETQSTPHLAEEKDEDREETYSDYLRR